MNWGSLKSLVLSRIHDTSLAAKVPDWFNEVQLELLGAAQWRHLEATQMFTTSAPQTSGTATATNGSPTVTFAGTTIPSSAAGQLILIGGLYYKIKSVDTTTQITLQINYSGTTGSGQTYQIVFYAADPPADLSAPRIYDATIQVGAGVLPLFFTTEHDLFEHWADEVRTLGHPTTLRFFANKVVLWPPPDGVYNIQLYYHRQPSVMSTTSVDSTVVDWPDDLQYPILQGMYAVGFEHIDDTLAASCRKRFEDGMQDAIARNNRVPMVGGGKLKRWDKPRASAALPYRIPEPI